MSSAAAVASPAAAPPVCFSVRRLVDGAPLEAAEAPLAPSPVYQLREARAPSIALYGQTGSGKSHALRVLLETYALLPSMRCMLVVDRQKGDLCAMACPELSLIGSADAAAQERFMRWMEEVDVRIWSTSKYAAARGLTLTLNPFPLTRFMHRIKHTIMQERGVTSAVLDSELQSSVSPLYCLYATRWSEVCMEIAQRLLSLGDAYPKAHIPKLEQHMFANKTTMDAQKLKARLGNLIVRVGLHPELCVGLRSVADLRQYLPQTVGLDQASASADFGERYPPLRVVHQPAINTVAAAAAAASDSSARLAASHPMNAFNALAQERHAQEEQMEVAFLFSLLEQFSIRMGGCSEPVDLPWTDDAVEDDGAGGAAAAPATHFFTGANSTHIFPIECDSFLRPRRGFKRVLNIVQFAELQQKHAAETDLITHQLFQCTETLLKHVRGKPGSPAVLLCLDEVAYTKHMPRHMLDALLVILRTGRSAGSVTLLATQDVLSMPAVLRTEIVVRLVGKVAVDKEERRTEIRRILECGWPPRALDKCLREAPPHSFHVAAGAGKHAEAPLSCTFQPQLLTYNEARFSTQQRDLNKFITDYTAAYLNLDAAVD